MNKKKIIIIISLIISILLLILGGTYAYWEWHFNSLEDITQVDFTAVDGLACKADGGSSISSEEMQLIPTYCDNSPYVLKKKISAEMINQTGEYPNLNLWLDIKSISPELSNSEYLSWAVSTSSNSCESGHLYDTGTFHNKVANDRVNILTSDIYPDTEGKTYKDYYLYIWLDVEETNNATQNGSFEFELKGECNTSIQNVDPDDLLYREDMLHGNDPQLVDGLIPITISQSLQSTTVKVANSLNEWYSYGDKQWANAVLVKTSGNKSRTYYQNHPGATITQSDILAYYVWIPRYSYFVWKASGIQYPVQEQEISIKFIDTNTIETATTTDEWYTHPAFWWDDDSDGVRDSGEELSGIWVGKFETSHNSLGNSSTENNLGTDSGSNICNSNSCGKYTGLRILPGAYSLRYNRISNFFNAARFMESSGNSFGLVASTVDSHMMKNSEWGAVAYLSHSKYGINSEIRLNNNSQFFTGCGAEISDGYQTPNCTNAYGRSYTNNIITGKIEYIYNQSTTGNITGVFDMSGGAYEYVMGHYGSTTNYGTESGFSSTYPLPDSKYYNNYIFTGDEDYYIDKCTLSTCGGHALNETNAWYSDYHTFVTTSSPWFIRGGYYTYSAQYPGSTGIFDFNSSYGRGYHNNTTTARIVLIADTE